MIRWLILTFPIALALLIASLGLWSYWFETTLRVERDTTGCRVDNERTLLFVHVKSGSITASLDVGSGYGGGSGQERKWWGNAGVSRRAENKCWRAMLPWWEPAVIFAIVPAMIWLRPLRWRRTSEDAGFIENRARANVSGRRSPRLAPFLGKSTSFLTFASASVAILSVWIRFDCETRNRDHGSPDAIWFNACAADGWFEAQFQYGTLNGGRFGGQRHWYGGFADFSDPGTLYWWLMLPGWLPASVLGGAAIAVWLRTRRRHRLHGSRL